MNIKFANHNDLENIIDNYNQAIKAGNATADINQRSSMILEGL